jgi:prevent-host-death family protein
MYNLGMSVMTVSQARAALPSVIDQVEAGEWVTITRHGRVVAVVVSPDALPAGPRVDLQWRIDRVGELLEQARERPLPKDGFTPERADELVAAIRADRER